MHSSDLTLEDEYKADSLEKMASFLQTVYLEMKAKYDDVDVSDCEAAMANIKKVSCCQCHHMCCFLYELKLA